MPHAQLYWSTKQKSNQNKNVIILGPWYDTFACFLALVKPPIKLLNNSNSYSSEYDWHSKTIKALTQSG